MKRFLLTRLVKAYLPWLLVALLAAGIIFVALAGPCGWNWVMWRYG